MLVSNLASLAFFVQSHSLYLDYDTLHYQQLDRILLPLFSSPFSMPSLLVLCIYIDLLLTIYMLSDRL